MGLLSKFKQEWKKGDPPPIKSVFVITNDRLQKKWDDYRKTLPTCVRHHDEEHFHGTSLGCNITTSRTLCSKRGCGICGIASEGMKCVTTDTQRFGKGCYLAPHSSKAHHYASPPNGRHYRAMLLCTVLPGRKCELTASDRTLKGPPQGYDSVHDSKGGATGEQKYPEIVLYNPAAIMPQCIIVYSP